MQSEARSARYGCTSNILPVAGLVTHLCTIPVRMGLFPPRETWTGGWAGSCGRSQVPGCHKQCRNRSSGWRRTEQASQRMIYVGVSAIRHGLCWGNENRGDTLIAPWRGRTRCLNAGPLASCGLTIGSRNNTRDRVAQPRLTRHRVDPIESSLKIYHMPCLGRVALPAQMQECCVRCEAERRAIVVRSDRCTAFAWQNKRFHRVPVVASFPGICGS